MKCSCGVLGHSNPESVQSVVPPSPPPGHVIH